ncbi:MAG: hypothetical protein A2542_01465 [Parcubacteria group bacterium RIFOXYD2_FULL_52_8]|nr:MAG: hypothetical protein A2542_01465 [Parcubacteria group bacterium RIFOXYD2_FULL_52_8]
MKILEPPKPRVPHTQQVSCQRCKALLLVSEEDVYSIYPVNEDCGHQECTCPCCGLTITIAWHGGYSGTQMNKKERKALERKYYGRD